MLVIFRGLPGTGKTWLAKKVLQRKPDLLVLSRDILRASIFPRPSYSAEEKDLVDDLILSMTDILVMRGRSVLIDGMALSSARRVQDFVDVAVTRGAPWRIIECSCSQETALARLRRDTGGHPAGDRGPALYFAVKGRFQPVSHPALAVDTDADSEGTLAAVLRYLELPPVL
jgi:predicted kinase